MSFSTPTGTERVAGAILKGAKTFSEGVLISVGRQISGRADTREPSFSTALSSCSQAVTRLQQRKLAREEKKTESTDGVHVNLF